MGEMLDAVLRMPCGQWSHTPIDELQRYNRYVEAADRIAALNAEVDRLREVVAWTISLSAWSQVTFGDDASRGPTGALKHLAKEVGEVLDDPTDLVEYADCLTLIVDAARRAGFGWHALVDAAIAKLEVNKSREWPNPTSNEPVEHVRQAAEQAAKGGGKP